MKNIRQILESTVPYKIGKHKYLGPEDQDSGVRPIEFDVTDGKKIIASVTDHARGGEMGIRWSTPQDRDAFTKWARSEATSADDSQAVEITLANMLDKENI